MLLIVFLSVWTVFSYKITVPPLSRFLKTILIAIRSIALILIVFLIFEPVLTLTKNKTVKPHHLVFVDNSSSIVIDDGKNRKGTISKFIDEIKSQPFSDRISYYSFGGFTKEVPSDSIGLLRFNEPTTNFSKIFTTIGQEENNISTITIISDGVVTDGSNPIYTAEKFGKPVFAVGVGDSTKRKDIFIQNVIHNDIIYAGASTTVLASFVNRGISNENVTVQFFEENVLIEQKQYFLNNEGLHSVSFDYSPQKPGEKKLTVKILPLKNEFSHANNSKIVFLNVLDNKIKVTLIGGMPSADLSFIKNSLLIDTNLVVNTITQIGSNKYLDNVNTNKLISEADILYLVGFPTSETSNNLLALINQRISEKNIPFFISLSPFVDVAKIRLLQSELPFSINKTVNGIVEVQAQLNEEEKRNPIVQNNALNLIETWNNLPPVVMPNWEISAKPEAIILSKLRINNVAFNTPLILSKKLGSKRSISVAAGDIWKWKLTRAQSNIDLFDRFILNSVKWLNAKEDKKLVRIKTLKKTFALGEQVELLGEVYDESFNPISDAEVKVSISNKNTTEDIFLNPLNNGIYEGFFQSNKSGDFSFSGNAVLNNKPVGKDNGRFSIGEIDIEKLNPVSDADLLMLLASKTKGKFFYNEEYNQLFPILQELDKKASKEVVELSEIVLWNNQWMLIIVILLLGFEWLIRKREGML